jgi:hypothetical protein
METLLHPLSGLRTRNFESQYFPPSVSADFDSRLYEFATLVRGSEGGFEREVGEEIRRTVPDLFGARGTYVPWSILTRGLSNRDMTAGGATTGAS